MATVFCLWVSTQFEPRLQEFMAYALILSFGVLHGANDLQIIKNLSKKNRKSLSLVHYLLISMAVIALFAVSRPLALLLFITISGYHFGEQHFEKAFTGKLLLGRILFLSYGLLILFMVFFAKSGQVSLIMQDLTQIEYPHSFFLVGLLGSLATFLIVFFVAIAQKHLYVAVVKELFFLILLYIVFTIASLPWAFAIYFVLWHSIPSINDQLIFLYGKADRPNFLKYLRTSWIYWALSLMGLLLMYFLLHEKVDYFITVVLYVLASITFPHVFVMSRIATPKTLL